MKTDRRSVLYYYNIIKSTGAEKSGTSRSLRTGKSAAPTNGTANTRGLPKPWRVASGWRTCRPVPESGQADNRICYLRSKTRRGKGGARVAGVVGRWRRQASFVIRFPGYPGDSGRNPTPLRNERQIQIDTGSCPGEACSRANVYSFFQLLTDILWRSLARTPSHIDTDGAQWPRPCTPPTRPHRPSGGRDCFRAWPGRCR